MVFPLCVGATEWSTEPNIQLQGGYDDNIRLAAGSREGVRSETFTPSIALMRNTPLSLTKVSAHLRFTRYSGDGVRDTNVQYLSFSSRYRQTRASWNIRGVFKRDTTLTTITEPDDLVDDVQDVDEGLFRVLVRRNRLDVEPSWQRSLTERASLRLGYKVRDVGYSNAGNTGLASYQRRELRAALTQRLSEKGNVSVMTMFSQYEAPSVGTETDGGRLALGIDHDFLPTMSGSAFIGRRQSSSITAGTQEIKSSGFVWRMGLKRAYSDLTSYRVSLERGLNSSGVGRVVRSDRFRFRLKKKVAPLLSASMTGYVLRNKALEGEPQSTDRTFYRADLGLVRTLSRYWSFNANYRYRWQKRVGDPLSARSNAIFVGVNYTHKLGI